ncbi:MAG: TonB-dependent receptor [Gemmatimonadota bacterium]
MPASSDHARRAARFGRAAGALAALLTAIALPGAAQGPATGSLRGEIVSDSGISLPGAQITLTEQHTGAVRSLRADTHGRFFIPVLKPGLYALVVEEVGFQPLRQLGVRVRQGRESAIRLALTPRPPPIISVEEAALPPHRPLPQNPVFGSVLPDDSQPGLIRRPEVSDLWRDATLVDGPKDGHEGFARSALGLPGVYSRLLVDGLNEGLLRHPFVPDEPAGAPAFDPATLSQVQVISAPFDLEWPGTAGVTLAAATASGGNDFRFEPSIEWSGGSLSASRRGNPADSATQSFSFGARMSGAVVRDVAHFLVALDYQTLEQPSALPSASAAAFLSGLPVNPLSMVATVAADSFGTGVQSFTQPVVRSWRGGRAFARADWQLSPVHSVGVRFGLNRWKEQNPLLGEDPVSGAGTLLEARDMSAAISVSSAWRSASNDFRAGAREGRRVWTGLALPTTYLLTEDIGIGASPALPGAFREQALEIADALTVPMRHHTLKGGFDLGLSRWLVDYLYGEGGIFRFGSLDDFASAEGTYLRASGPSLTKFSEPGLGLFLQDRWEVMAGLNLSAGVRFERYWYTRGPHIDTTLAQVTGLRNDQRPVDAGHFGPRAGITWDISNRHTWVLRAGAGVFTGPPDIALVAEAMTNNGNVSVRRTEGSLRLWPAPPDTSVASVTAARVTLFTPGFRQPRTRRVSAGLSYATGRSIAVSLEGGYQRSEFLLRRTDANRLPVPLGVTQEGRPVFGNLIQRGALIAAAPGSNRQFSAFDQISALTASGHSEAWDATLSIEGRVGLRLRLNADYTWSQVRDDRPLGRSGDPADDLDPFPQGPLAGAWAQGTSDFDLPHHLLLRAAYDFPRLLGLTLAVRYRYRSGLPFSPGFKPGVDANGDGSGTNDPAFLDATIPGMPALLALQPCLAHRVGAFASRNSCREPGDRAVDVSASVRLPIASLDGRVVLTLEAFNLLQSPSGLRDHAAVLVDASRALSTGPAGNVVLPLVANPEFGKLVGVRSENRLLRVGVRVIP